MILVSIDITNWKCFTSKHIDFNENINLFRWENGTGKTSLIEAIIFCLWDKRPAGLDFDSLRNDLESNCKLVLKFKDMLDEYIIEREFGSSSSYRLYKNNVLISRTRADNLKEISKIIPDTVLNGLWGYNSLALSAVLKTDFLYTLLETEFKEPLELKKYFQTDRTIHQKQISNLEKIIKDQTITQTDLDNLAREIDELNNKIKSKVFIDDQDIIRARQCKNEYPNYIQMKEQLSFMSFDYDRNTCLRLNNYHLHNKKDWDAYFANIEQQLIEEKQKATELHPLAKYPKKIINDILAENQQSGHCIFCGGKYKPITINYDVVDVSKIEQLEKILEDRKYDFSKLASSIKYFQLKKKIEDLSYLDTFDWQTILANYDAESKKLYEDLELKTRQYESMKQSLTNINLLLEHKKQYAEDKDCMNIVDEYIEAAKAYYANSITLAATKILQNINPRYQSIFIENGIYKVLVSNIDYTSQMRLPIMTLSMGEKTIVALSLILAIRNLFLPSVPIIMDEPFSNLDSQNIDAINRILENEQSQWLLVAHDNRIYVK